MKNSLKNQFEGFLKTPSLWHNSELLNLKQFYFPEIKVPTDSEILKSIPSLSTNFVLGKRIESFFGYGIKLSGKYRILAENIQISQNRITQGEIDFLLEGLISAEQFHIEVVYKFYVYDPGLKFELEKWIGPNRKDTLLRKLKKLREHQFPILFNTATRRFLHTLGFVPGYFQQKVCFKAHLFIPKNCQGKTFPYINKECISGYWITLEEFDTEDYFKFRYFAPKKQDWPIEPQNNEIWYSFDQTKIQIQELFSENKSPLIWMKKNTVEFERFFVVWW